MRVVFLSIVCGLVIVLSAQNSQAADVTAREIMEQVDARNDGDRSVSDMAMTLIDKHGKQRQRLMRSFGLDKGDDTYSLMFFLAPADVKDSGFLTYDYKDISRDDDQWLYLPALKKTKRIAVHDKSGSFMGSDFSYADLTRFKLDDYDYSFDTRQQEAEVYGKKAWVIDSLPRNKEVIDETGYSKSILFVRQDNFMVVRAVHFLEKNGELKYFDVKKMAEIDNIWTNLEIYMTRKKGGRIEHKTILTMKNVRYNQESVNEEMFSIRTLEKGL